MRSRLSCRLFPRSLVAHAPSLPRHILLAEFDGSAHVHQEASVVPRVQCAQVIAPRAPRDQTIVQVPAFRTSTA